jgi:hypothetical protein
MFRCSVDPNSNKFLIAAEGQVDVAIAFQVGIQAVGRERRFPKNIHRMEKRFKAGIGVPALQLEFI